MSITLMLLTFIGALGEHDQAILYSCDIRIHTTQISHTEHSVPAHIQKYYNAAHHTQTILFHETILTDWAKKAFVSQELNIGLHVTAINTNKNNN